MCRAHRTMEFSQKIARFLRVCAHCSSWLGPKDLFCEYCWRELEQEVLPLDLPCRGAYPFRLITLWDWKGQGASSIKSLLYAFKEGGLPQAVDDLAFYLCRKAVTLKRWTANPHTQIFPAPPKEKGSKDHAFELAQAISHRLQIPLNAGLERLAPERAQKNLGRRQRQTIKMAYSGVPIHGPVLFIDDLVTTGSTALAAWRALGRPSDFQVWSLCERSSLLPDDPL